MHALDFELRTREALFGNNRNKAFGKHHFVCEVLFTFQGLVLDETRLEKALVGQQMLNI